RAMNMAPFIFWNLAFYTIIRTQLEHGPPIFLEEAILHNYTNSTGTGYIIQKTEYYFTSI
ncbi:hypothetical protein ABNC94_21405, partial [Paenibacillus larvae]